MKNRSKSIFNIFTLFTLLISLLGNALTFTPAYAAGAILVNSNLDIVGDDHTCTLREAITSANTDTVSGALSDECAAGSGTDTITFAADYTITLAGSQLPAVTTAIIINGNGAAKTIIEANAAPNTANYRVFEVTGAGNLTLEGLTVRNGRCNGSCATTGNSGGGIYNAGAMTVSNVTISANSATNGGGMLTTLTSSPTLTNVIFNANSATSNGGGMYNNNNGSSSTLTNVTFNSNSAASGGGMATDSSPTLTNVTFSANSATVSFGGGMTVYFGSPKRQT